MCIASYVDVHTCAHGLLTDPCIWRLGIYVVVTNNHVFHLVFSHVLVPVAKVVMLRSLQPPTFAAASSSSSSSSSIQSLKFKSPTNTTTNRALNRDTIRAFKHACSDS